MGFSFFQIRTFTSYTWCMDNMANGITMDVEYDTVLKELCIVNEHIFDSSIEFIYTMRYIDANEVTQL